MALGRFHLSGFNVKRRCATASHSLSPRSEAERGEGRGEGQPHALLLLADGFEAAQATRDTHSPAIGTAPASLLDQLRRPYHNDRCAPLPLTPPSPRKSGERE